MDEVKFRYRIHTKLAGQPSACSYIATIEEASALVKSLSLEQTEKSHWQQAEIALAQSAECPADEGILKIAESAFREALKGEGWLADS